MEEYDFYPNDTYDMFSITMIDFTKCNKYSH